MKWTVWRTTKWVRDNEEQIKVTEKVLDLMEIEGCVYLEGMSKEEAIQVEVSGLPIEVLVLAITSSFPVIADRLSSHCQANRDQWVCDAGPAVLQALNKHRGYCQTRQQDDSLFWLGVRSGTKHLPSNHVRRDLPTPEEIEKMAMRDLTIDVPQTETMSKLDWNQKVFNWYANNVLFNVVGK